MRIALHTCLPDNFLVCWPPATALSVFHGKLPHEICDTTSPMFIMGNLFSPHGESTSWNFPAKIKNSLRPIPSFDMMSKFPGSDHSCRRRYVALLSAERRIGKKNKEISCQIVVFRGEYLRNGKRYSSSVFTLTKCMSHATKQCNPRLCRCYRFGDIKSSTSWFSNVDLYDVGNSKPVRMNSHG